MEPGCERLYPEELFADIPDDMSKRKELLGIYDGEVKNHNCNYGDPTYGWQGGTLSFDWFDVD